MKTKSWMLGLLAAACAGCVSTPMPDLQVALPSSYQQATPRTTTDGSAADRSHWWQAFGDPRLDALEHDAMDANLDIAQAAARLRAARALNKRADASLRPEVHFRTSDPIDPDASASYLVAGFDAVWELGLFGRNTAVHRMSRGTMEGANAELRDAQLSVSAEVARQWILLREAQQRQTTLTRIRELRDRQAALTSTRIQLHLSAVQEQAQVRLAALQADAALAEPREAAVSAAQALAVLLGRAEPDPSWLQPGSMPSTESLVVTSAPADLLRARPDVARDQAAVVRAAGELGLAKADMYPSIALGGSIVQSFSEVERLNKNPGSIGSFGPIIDIPLFDWGMRRAQVEAKGEDLQAAALAYRKTVLTAVAEVETALAANEQQRLRELDDLQALQASKEIAQANATRHRLKLISGIELAASDADHEQAVLELASVRATRAIDYIALCKALGGAPATSAVPTTSVGGTR